MLSRLLQSPQGEIGQRKSHRRLLANAGRTASQATVGEQTEGPNSQISIMARDEARDEEIQELMGSSKDVVFISPEEEKKVQKILELARKGKINSQNAFDLPVRVLDIAQNQSVNSRFWKFASELLGASINIYDKRVDNVVQSTHRMFQSLSIFNNQYSNQDQTDQGPISRKKKQKQQNIVDLSQFDPKNMDSHEIILQKLQEKEKLAFKNPMSHFSEDPIFSANLKVFDSNCMDTLFLNIFYCNSKLEVNLFNSDTNLVTESVPTTFFNSSSANEMKNQIHKSNILISSLKAFQDISRFKAAKVDDTMMRTNNINSVKDLVRDNRQDSVESLFDALTNEQRHSATSIDQDLFTNQNFDNNRCESKSNNCAPSFPWPHSRRTIQQSYFDIPIQDQVNAFSLQSPWEIQIKGGKIYKKLASKRTEIKKVIDQNLSFDPFAIEDKARVLQKNIFLKKFEREININQHLRSKQLFEVDIFKQNLQQRSFMRRKKRNSQRKLQIEGKQIEIYNKQIRGFSEQSQNQIGKQIIEMQPNIESRSGIPSTEGMGSRSIREIKEQIMNEVQLRGSVRLSSLTMGLSAQSMTTLFLHIVSEMNLKIQSCQDQTDLILYL